MANIVSLGIGSGLDINSIVSDLVELQKRPQLQRLDVREAGLQGRLSGLGTLKGALGSLQDALANLNRLQTFRARSVDVADPSILGAGAGTAAAAGIYDISVAELARTHKLASDPSLHQNARFTSVNDQIGTGTLTFRFGTTAYNDEDGVYQSFDPDPDASIHDIEVTDGSLRGVRDAINKADIGVTASLVYDGEHYRLALAGAGTGAKNSFEITVQDDDGDNADASGLSLLAFNDGGAHMRQTQAAQDTAGLVVNGIAISSASNSLVNVIEGLTIDIKASGATTVTVTQDREGASAAIREFVDKFNGLVTTINQLSRFDPETGEAGLLNGDRVLQTLDAQVRRIMNQPIGGADDPFRYLADIGITRSAGDGTLVLEEARLQRAMDQDFDAIAGLFANVGIPDDPLISYQAAGNLTQPGDYAVNITRLATRGMVTGSATATLEIVAGVNDTLNVSINGIAATISIGAGSYASADALAAEVQARVNGAAAMRSAGVSIQVSAAGGVLQIVSETFGSASQVTVNGGNGLNGLLGGSPASVPGVDVAGTIGGVAATGSGQILIGNGDAEGLRLRIAGGEIGARGGVSFSRGYADRLDRMVSGMLSGDGIFNSVTDSINRSISDINAQRERVELRSLSYEERIRAQFTAMDELVAQLRSTSEFLTQQLDNLPRIGQGRASR